jgi:F0F1-type ATP synthase gamma subunit
VTSKVAYLETGVLEYKKQITAAVKSAASAATNKADKAKKQSNSFLKCLTKLGGQCCSKALRSKRNWAEGRHSSGSFLHFLSLASLKATAQQLVPRQESQGDVKPESRKAPTTKPHVETIASRWIGWQWELPMV